MLNHVDRSRLHRLFWLTRLLILVVMLSCSNEEPTLEVTSDEIMKLEGEFPAPVYLSDSGQNGAFDPSVATDPQSGRVWMVYSSVVGLVGQAMVSTHLAFSDDGGITWFHSGVINQSENVAVGALPDQFSDALSAHWQHEVPSIVYDAAAPNEERWKVLWHRYLSVEDGISDTDDRRFVYGWIASKSAPEPSQLTSASEQKLFSAGGYHKSPEVEHYNNTILGPPQTMVHELNAQLSDVLVMTEVGMTDFAGDLYLSFVGIGRSERDVGLLKLDHTTNDWNFMGVVLKGSDAKGLNRKWNSFSASEMFVKGSQAYLLVSPESELYEGTLLFKIELPGAEVLRDLNGLPQIIYSIGRSAGAFQTGASTYDPGLRGIGILYGDVLSQEPQFRIFSTGVVP